MAQRVPIDPWYRLAFNSGASATVGGLCHAAERLVVSGAADRARTTLKGNTILIDGRFRGPQESGNGGYVCGRLSQFIDSTAAAVRLRVPPPLAAALEVRESEAGVALFDGEVVVAEARPAKVSLAPPPSPPATKCPRPKSPRFPLARHVFGLSTHTAAVPMIVATDGSG